MTDPAPEVPADIRTWLETVAARLPREWILAEVTRGRRGWIARFTTGEGAEAAVIAMVDLSAGKPGAAPPSH